MTTSHVSASPDVALLPATRVRQAAFAALALTLAAVQFSVAIAQIFLAVALLSWATLLVIERRRPRAPAWALPLLLYAGWTLISVAFSISPVDSLLRAKQLVLLLLVPLTYDLADRDSAVPLTTVILAAGAVSAVLGVGQYAILHYDDFGRRPIGTVGFAMTFTGLIMLTLGLAMARVLFMTRERMWPSLMLPALAAALAVSFLRNAWVGASVGVAVLLLMRDFRLTALLPLVVAVFFVFAPDQFARRFYSIFDLSDVTVRDRIGMMRAGERIVRDYPITGVGPEMIARVYPQYRAPDALLQVTPHLHNVPLQIAAERGLPALAFWIWFIGAVLFASWALYRRAPREGPQRFLAAAAIGSVVSMLAAGMFEHNFGDSEFLMLFLALITLPFAATKTTDAS
ncbi:MAG: O-antigen ligase family protein [Vicinamibacterales bacterium]